MKFKVVKKSILRLEEKFSKNPLDYTVEDSLVAELQNILREDGCKISVSCGYKDFEDERYEEDYTQYKEKYLGRICGHNKIHNVQIQVNFGNKKENKLLDLAVLRRNDTEIKLIQGTKYFTPRSIEHAIEIKFVKNKNLPPKNPVEGFERDFEKLKGLDEPKSKHFMIFSNKNIFQRGEEDRRSTEIANDRFKELKKGFKKENIIIKECYPGKEIEKE